VLINRLSFPPVTGSDYPNNSVPVRKTYRDYAFSDLAKTVVTLFFVAMVRVLRDETMRISKGVLGNRKRYTMLFPVFLIFSGVPFEMRFCHGRSLSENMAICHTFIWVFIWINIRSYDVNGLQIKDTDAHWNIFDIISQRSLADPERRWRPIRQHSDQWYEENGCRHPPGIIRGRLRHSPREAVMAAQFHCANTRQLSVPEAGLHNNIVMIGARSTS
jgi:hypothetical protein